MAGINVFWANRKSYEKRIIRKAINSDFRLKAVESFISDEPEIIRPAKQYYTIERKAAAKSHLKA